MSAHLLPATATNGATDGVLAHTELVGQRLLRHATCRVPSPDLDDVGLGQLGITGIGKGASQVPPVDVANDVTDADLTQAELIGKILLGNSPSGVPVSDLDDLFIGELRRPVALTSGSSPPLVSVTVVVGNGSDHPVGWVLAPLHIAGVSDHETIGDWADVVPVPPTMSKLLNPVVLHPPVPGLEQWTSPQVASIRRRCAIDIPLVLLLGWEAPLWSQGGMRIAMHSNSLVVHGAHATTPLPGWLRASLDHACLHPMECNRSITYRVTVSTTWIVSPDFRSAVVSSIVSKQRVPPETALKTPSLATTTLRSEVKLRVSV